MNTRTLRLAAPALVSVIFAAALAGCGSHDTSVGSASTTSNLEPTPGRSGEGGGTPDDGGKGGGKSGGAPGDGGKGGGVGGQGGDVCDGTGDKAAPAVLLDCVSGQTLLDIEAPVPCAQAREKCLGFADGDAKANVHCVWGGLELFAREAVPGACGEGGDTFVDPCDGAGEKAAPAVLVDCANGETLLDLGASSSCSAARGQCGAYVAAHPEGGARCVWGGLDVFAYEPSPGVCD
jgi:hypothetical protein